MTRPFAAAFACFAAIPLLSGAEAASLDASRVPQDAKWVVHIDGEAFSRSALAERVRDKQPEKVQYIRRLLEERFGVNPQRDLKSLTLFGDDYRRHAGAAILTANYDQEKVKRELESHENVETTESGDHTLYTCTMHKQARDNSDGAADKDSKDQINQFTTVLFDDDTIIFAHSPDEAKAAIGLLEGDEPSLKDSDSPLVADVPEGAIVYGAAIDLSEISQHVPPFPILAQHDRIQYAFGQDGDEMYKCVTLVAKNREVARNMRRALEGFVSLGKVWAGDAHKLAELYDDTDISRRGTTVTAEWRGSVQDVMTALDELEPRIAAWREARQAR